MRQIIGKKLREYKYLLLLVAIFATLWMLFSPAFYATVDEHNYIRSAYLLSKGENLKSVADQSLGGFANNDGDYVSKYNLGSSIILAVFQPGAVSFQGSLVVNLLLSLMGMLAVFWLMRNLLGAKHSWLILLIGLYPPVVYFSRTAFSEVSSWVLLIVSALLAYKYFTSIAEIAMLRASLTMQANKFRQIMLGIGLGVSLGLLVLTRYNLALWAVVLILTGLVVVARNLWFKHDFAVSKIASVLMRSLIPIIIGVAPTFLLFLLINSLLYGCLLCSGYKLSGEESLQLTLLPERIWQYLLYLTPILLVLPALSRSWLKWPYLFTIYPLLLLYSVAGGILFGENPAVNFIYGVRFFMPILPLGILLSIDALANANYSRLQARFKFFSRFLKSKFAFIVKALFLKVLIASAVWVSSAHFEFTQIRFNQFMQVNAEIVQKFGQNPELERLYVIGGDGDFIFIGEHLQADFARLGYLDVTSKTELEIEQLLSGIQESKNDYILVNFSENSPSSKKSQQVLETLDAKL